MSKVEYVDLSGLRIDGRRPNELRKVVIKHGNLQNATGSTIFHHGNTKVSDWRLQILATVCGPRECTSRSKELHDRALVTCSVIVSPSAYSHRRKRNRGDRVVGELESLIRQTFEELIFTSIFPRSQIDISVEIIQADGPVRACAINAVSMALIDAGLPIKDFLCACEVGYIDGQILLDMNGEEESARGPDLYVSYMPCQDAIVSTFLEPRLPLEVFGQVRLRGCLYFMLIDAAGSRGRTHRLQRDVQDAAGSSLLPCLLASADAPLLGRRARALYRPRFRQRAGDTLSMRPSLEFSELDPAISNGANADTASHVV
eukprot:654834-Hanusia_phi.AAC.1